MPHKNNENADEGVERFGYKAASEYLGVPTGTLYAKVRNGSIPHVRLGKRLVRFERSALDAWLAQNRVTPIASEASEGGGK